MPKLVHFDFAIKNLLRNKANFDILEGFLSELLHMSNITTRYEVVYLVSFYMKGLEF